MTATGAHTVKAFDEDIEQLRALVAELGGCAESAIHQAMAALARLDAEAAAAVIEHHHRIDAIAADIERRGVCIIALRAPMADDLREVLAALKTAHAAARIGDRAKAIARRIPLIGRTRGLAAHAMLPRLAAFASAMVAAALDAFAGREPGAVETLGVRRGELGQVYDSLFAASLADMVDDPHNITSCAHLLFVAQSLEQIADHAVEIAGISFFAATGGPWPPLAPRLAETAPQPL